MPWYQSLTTGQITNKKQDNEIYATLSIFKNNLPPFSQAEQKVILDYSKSYQEISELIGINEKSIPHYRGALEEPGGGVVARWLICSRKK